LNTEKEWRVSIATTVFAGEEKSMNRHGGKMIEAQPSLGKISPSEEAA
jgi:hypothetical protein